MASTLSESSRIPTNPSRIVLITGVSKGLGRALALELANRGHTIIGCSRDQPKLDSLRQQLSSNNHLLFNANVRSNDSVEELARAVVQNKLVPDIIVNNAGVANRIGNAWEVEVEEFDNVIDTNVKGIANVLRHFIPLMIPNKHGIIINMSSIAGRTGIAHIAPYCASKWAVEGLSKSIAKELPEGMAVVALDPGTINTDMLVSVVGSAASKYLPPKRWAIKAATMILDITTSDNGASLTVKDPTELSNP
ncbi:NADPH-dependent pterin aldehyde reductase-like isoform X3 [Cucurbita pepo subsp. pepo]|uniref:NADPH-dependent pterin aldehyde reductase-like isoform X3 n=1 Tax=Cucurbita pepo subsp. pepo TaxID=3664 RepID=UPI000C9D8C68|nr:NADPH-dependent pterin aldehyde reductase-like isoform X3 [Cucurbita pepo subsp. pepo]